VVVENTEAIVFCVHVLLVVKFAEFTLLDHQLFCSMVTILFILYLNNLLYCKFIFLQKNSINFLSELKLDFFAMFNVF
jgi:hypothetical protein